ncbi:MAG: HepT-like ribonuclease domain-containing protein [Patescibacteria group bacterium]
MLKNDAKMRELKKYCENDKDIILAFLYGSQARGTEMDESDFDVAVLLTRSDQEDRVWRDLSRMVDSDVDLVALDRAPATLTSNVLKTGIPLTIKDRGQYLDLYLEKTNEAEDFTGFAKSYREIADRSHSLTPEDKTRLIERVQFLKQELSELERFRVLSYQTYQEDRTRRREIERWTENIINALIDCAKIILASEKKAMPKTYEAALSEFALLAGLDEGAALRLSTLARLRNILAHEYLDILYEKIQIFIKDFSDTQKEVFLCLKKYTESE